MNLLSPVEKFKVKRVNILFSLLRTKGSLLEGGAHRTERDNKRYGISVSLERFYVYTRTLGVEMGYSETPEVLVCPRGTVASVSGGTRADRSGEVGVTVVNEGGVVLNPSVTVCTV